MNYKFLKQLLIFIVSLVLFVGLNAGISYILQKYLYLFINFGSYVHWAAIFLFLPLISGFILRFLQNTYRYLTIVSGAILAALILYPMYRDIFWAEPPHPIVGVYYALCICGIALIPNLNYTRLLRIIRSGKRLKNFKNEKSKSIGTNTSNNKLIETEENKLGKDTLPGIFESPRYAGLLATIQLAIAVFSLIISAISIFVLGSK